MAKVPSHDAGAQGMWGSRNAAIVRWPSKAVSPRQGSYVGGS